MIDCHVERGQNPSKRACKDSLQGTQKWKPIHIPGHLRKWSPRVRIPEHLPQAGEDQGRQIVEQRADPPRQCRQGRAHHQHTERRIRLQGSQTYTEAKRHTGWQSRRSQTGCCNVYLWQPGTQSCQDCPDGSPRPQYRFSFYAEDNRIREGKLFSP